MREGFEGNSESIISEPETPIKVIRVAREGFSCSAAILIALEMWWVAFSQRRHLVVQRRNRAQNQRGLLMEIHGP